MTKIVMDFLALTTFIHMKLFYFRNNDCVGVYLMDIFSE